MHVLFTSGQCESSGRCVFRGSMGPPIRVLEAPKKTQKNGEPWPTAAHKPFNQIFNAFSFLLSRSVSGAGGRSCRPLHPDRKQARGPSQSSALVGGVSCHDGRRRREARSVGTIRIQHLRWCERASVTYHHQLLSQVDWHQLIVAAY